MTHNIPLNVLDEYAKTITVKQANMLYESKCNKKFAKPLYENMKYLNDDSYSIYLNNFVLDEASSSIDKTLIRYVKKHNLQYNVVSDGVYLYTPNKTDYIDLIESLVNDGFDTDTLKYIVEDAEASEYLKKL